MEPTAGQQVVRWSNWVMRAFGVLVGLWLLAIFLLDPVVTLLVDRLWFTALGQGTVFSTRLTTQIVIGGSAFVAAVGFLWFFRHRLLQALSTPAAAAPRMLRVVTGLGAVLGALIVGSGIGEEYPRFLLWQTAVPFDRVDPVFHRAYDFYIYRLPVLDLLVNEAATTIFIALAAVAVVWFTLASSKNTLTNFSQRLKGWKSRSKLQFWLILMASGFVLLGAFGSEILGFLFLVVALWVFVKILFAATFTPGPTALSQLRHLFFRLLGLLLIVLAGWEFLQRATLAFHGSSPVLPTASWLDVVYVQHYRALVAIVLALLGGWILLWPDRPRRYGRLAAGFFVFVLLGSSIVPAAIRTVYVRPNELELESPLIQAHLDATRYGYGLDNVALNTVNVNDSPSPTDLAASADTLANIRVWDYRAFDTTNRELQSLETYYSFQDGDTDRYLIQGGLQQVLISARELNRDALPDVTQGQWLIPYSYTHGTGVTVAQANEATASGRPAYLVQDVPPVVTADELTVDEPRLYVAERTMNDIFLSRDLQEIDGASPGARQFAGSLPMNSLARRVLFAFKPPASLNVLLSRSLGADSEFLTHRTLKDRLDTLAPIIAWSSDPYPVINNGRIVWIVDGATQTSHLPLGAPYSDYEESARYYRNSVKATVDAGSGEVHLYVVDETDPLIQSWRIHFPTLFESISAAPPSIVSHFRYGLDLFERQSDLMNTYHVTDPFEYYSRQDLWQTPQEVTQQGGDASLMESYFNIVNLPGQTGGEFVLLRPATAYNKTNMTAWYAGRSDGEHLGELVVYRFPKDSLVQGPEQVATRIDQDPELSKTFSLWNQEGSQVIRGGMYVLPVGQSLIYVQPIYLQSRTNPIPELRLVVLATQDQLVFAPTAAEALAKLIPAQ